MPLPRRGLIARILFVISSIIMASPAEALSGETALLCILRQAFPNHNIKSYETEHTISQANAEGQRLTILMHEEDHHDEEVFVKQVLAADYVATKKDWADLRRTLLYMRTEARFYSETLRLLKQKGFRAAPYIYLSTHNLDEWVPDDEMSIAPASAVPPTIYTQTLEQQQACEHGEGDMDDAHKWETGAGVIVMECISESRYLQESPITVDQAKLCLEAVADLHASAWEDVDLLTHAAQRLSRASFHLDMRNIKELQNMEASWEHFATAFQEQLQSAGLMTRTQHLGLRLKKCAEHISREVSPGPTEKYCTVAHGDYKAMNVFLPKDATKDHALLVDFASTGIGLGMADVAMHVHHAVRPEDLANGGEEALVEYYLSALNDRLKALGKSYSEEVALRHYRYSVVDYGRFVLGRFWKVATPEAMEKKKNSKNTFLGNRDIPAAMAFVDRIERYLSEIEAEMKGKQQPIQSCRAAITE